jgi:RHS repeat-associated protein
LALAALLGFASSAWAVPTITSFTATPNPVTVPNSFTLQMQVSEELSGSGHAAVIADGQGNWLTQPCLSGTTCTHVASTNWGMQDNPPTLHYQALVGTYAQVITDQENLSVQVQPSELAFDVTLDMQPYGSGTWRLDSTVSPTVPSGLSWGIGKVEDYGLAIVANCTGQSTCTATNLGPGHYVAGVVASFPSVWLAQRDIFIPSGIDGSENRGGCNPSELGCCSRGQEADPCDTATGEFWLSESDLTVPGRGPPLDFKRTYSSIAAPVSASRPLGYGWTHSYAMSLTEAPSGNVVIEQENGSTVRFTEDGGDYEAPSRVLASLEKNTDGSWTFTRRKRTEFRFDEEGRLQAQEDLNGNRTELAYDTAGRLQTITGASGRELELAYNTANRIESVTDSANREVSYAYNSAGELTDVTDAGGGEWAYTYDSGHRILTVTDPRGKAKVTNTYDSATRIATQTDALDRETSFDYTTTGTLVTRPSGTEVLYEYDEDGLLADKTEAPGTADEAVWSYEYDPDTQGLSSVIDPNQNETTMTYDDAGNLTSVTDPLDHTTSHTYDALNNRTSTTDARGVTTTLDYDQGGNLAEVSTPLTGTSPLQHEVWTYEHEDTAHPEDITEISDPNGNVTEIAYDAHGMPTSVTDGEGNETTNQYDSLSRLTSSVSPRGNAQGGTPADHTTTYTYNAYGDPTSVEDPLGGTTSYGYDAARNLTSLEDPLQNETTYVYDDANQLVEIERADQSALQNSYDLNGNLASQTDGASEVTSYDYDALDRLESVTDPLLRTTSYDYDDAGNQTQITDPLSRTTTFVYDDANRLTSIDYSSSGTPDASFGYDAEGQRTSMSDGTGNSSFSYDSLDRLTSQTDGNANTVDYEYDLAGNVTEIGYPGGSSQDLTRAFDEANRLTTVTDWQSRTTSFGYDADSNLTSITFPNASGNVDTYGYDDADRMTSAQLKQGSSDLATLSYTRDDAGQVTQESQTGLPGASSTSYTYTPLNQLASAGSASYAYDDADNITQLDGVSGYTYDDANQLTGIPSGAPGGAATLSYDALGQRTQYDPASGPTIDYGYDQAGRLTSAGSDTYSYSGDGLRIGADDGSSAKEFSWDRSGDLPMMLHDGSTSYIYGPAGTPVAEIAANGTPSYYHHDQLGSTRLLTAANGASSATRTYAPFGEIAGSTGSQVPALGFAGEYTDHGTGMQYLRARYLDPSTGQFMSRDPLITYTRSAYGYGFGNPLFYLDPSGLGPCIGGFIACDEDDDPCDSALSGPMVAACLVPDNATEGFANISGGVGDQLLAPVPGTPGVGPWLRDQFGLSSAVDMCSPEYQRAGTVTQVVQTVVDVRAVIRNLPRTIEAIRRAERKLGEKFVPLPPDVRYMLR